MSGSEKKRVKSKSERGKKAPKVFLFVAISLLVAALAVALILAYAFPVGDRLFVSGEDGGAVYVGGGEPDELVVPSVVDGNAVTEVNGESIPDSVRTLVLPESLTDIAPGEFSELKELNEIIVDNSSYGTADGAAYEKDAGGNLVKLVAVPAGKTEIASYPNSLCEIGERAFENTRITSLTLPDGVADVASSAFTGGGISEIRLTSPQLTLRDGALDGMVFLNRVVLSGALTAAYALPQYGDDVWIDEASGEEVSEIVFGGTYYLAGGTSGGFNYTTDESDRYYITGVPAGSGALTIPATLTVGGSPVNIYGAGYDSKLLNINGYSSITISAGIVEIGKNAFRGCSEMTAVSIPTSVVKIGDHAFYGCNYINSIPVPNSVSEIGDYAFAFSRITSLTIPASVRTIGSFAFYKCVYLASVTINSGLQSVGAYAFSECAALNSVALPNTVNSVGNYAFKNCAQLDTATLSTGISSVSAGMFDNCERLEVINLSSAVTTVGDWSFRNCAALNSVSFGSSVTTIGKQAFSRCVMLQAVTIPPSVRAVGVSAFEYCAILNSLTISNGVETIGGGAFSRCSLLAAVTIPASVTDLGDGVFTGCTNLATININAGNQVYQSDASKRAILSKSGSTFIRYVAHANTAAYTVPAGVSTVAPKAFQDCFNLTSVAFASSVNTIGDSALANCVSLTSLTVPSTVTSIGDYAFSGCSSLTSITIGSGVTLLYAHMFSGCTSLATVDINALNSVYYDTNGTAYKKSDNSLVYDPPN